MTAAQLHYLTPLAQAGDVAFDTLSRDWFAAERVVRHIDDSCSPLQEAGLLATDYFQDQCLHAGNHRVAIQGGRHNNTFFDQDLFRELEPELVELAAAYDQLSAEAQCTLQDIGAQVLEAGLGLKYGDIVNPPEGGTAGRPFAVQHVGFAESRQSRQWVCGLSISGSPLRADGKVGTGRPIGVHVTSFAQARTELGIGPAQLQHPDAMSLSEVADELEGSLAGTHHNGNGWDETQTGHEVVKAWRALAAGWKVPEYLTESGAALSLHLDITSPRRNLVLEWSVMDGRVGVPYFMQPYSQSRTRLLQIFVGPIMDPHRRWGSEEDRARPLSAHEQRAARRHDLLTRLAVGVANGYLQALCEQVNVRVVCNWASYLRTGAEPGQTELAMTWRVHPAKVQPHALESATGLALEALANVTAYDWRASTEEALRAWGAAVRNAGGREMSIETLRELELEALRYYREIDPVLVVQELAKRQEDAHRAAQEKAQEEAARPSKVRELLATLTIGHKSGWSRAVAEAAGCHPTDVKRWLKKHLPDEFARLYPEGKGLAKSSASV